MFPEAAGQHSLSLMPASQFPQKKVGIVAGAADVVHDDRAAKLAGVIDDDVAKTHQALRDAGGDSHVLNFAQRDVFGGAADEAGIDLELGVGHRVLDHVSAQMVVRGNQQNREREQDRDPRGGAEPREEEYECQTGNDGESVAGFDEEHRRPNREDGLLEVGIAVEIKGPRLHPGDSGCFRIVDRSPAIRAVTDTWGYVCSTGTRHRSQILASGNHAATDQRGLVLICSDLYWLTSCSRPSGRRAMNTLRLYMLSGVGSFCSTIAVLAFAMAFGSRIML